MVSHACPRNRRVADQRIISVAPCSLTGSRVKQPFTSMYDFTKNECILTIETTALIIEQRIRRAIYIPFIFEIGAMRGGGNEQVID